AKHHQNETWQVLLSRDLDKVAPWLDSRAEITQEWVQQAAKKLELSEEAVQHEYEALAEELPLRLSWHNQEQQA
ncbi:wHTH domain-containing protein, partial [Candidatus Venteria ishoeyi]|uniref:wHTH domain-containing protein n=1 Tax=Candidatus Venteria ishoeyi TaxID=1899563 RepID=UPI0015AACB10